MRCARSDIIPSIPKRRSPPLAASTSRQIFDTSHRHRKVLLLGSNAYHRLVPFASVDHEDRCGRLRGEVLAGASETGECPELVPIITKVNEESVKYGEGIESVSSS
jgi:hypothetical protein